MLCPQRWVGRSKTSRMKGWHRPLLQWPCWEGLLLLPLLLLALLPPPVIIRIVGRRIVLVLGLALLAFGLAGWSLFGLCLLLVGLSSGGLLRVIAVLLLSLVLLVRDQRGKGGLRLPAALLRRRLLLALLLLLLLLGLALGARGRHGAGVAGREVAHLVSAVEHAAARSVTGPAHLHGSADHASGPLAGNLRLLHLLAGDSGALRSKDHLLILRNVGVGGDGIGTISANIQFNQE
mmetsp:Transcript_125316/g.304290  ORF Transcript_125316/g.304290 Transcript_125316/m.304290 type:complete len:235 (-) Transcript_125316:165-869(-)